MATKVRWIRGSGGFLEQGGDGFKEAGGHDEFADGRWDFLQGRLRRLQFFSDRFDVDLSKAFFERGLTLEKDFQIGGIAQIADQQGVGDHALEKGADRILTGSAASATPEIPKQSFHEVVGPLGLDEQRSAGSLHRDRIGKELFLVLIDLVDHPFPPAVGIVIRTGSDLVPELLHRFLDGSQGEGIAAGV